MPTPTLRARPRLGPIIALAGLALAGLALVACGDERAAGDGTTVASTTIAPTTVTPTTVAPTTVDTTPKAAGATPTAATEPPTPVPYQVDATIRDFAVDIPAEIPSGFVRVTATNAGSIGHHLILARIADGTTYDQWLATFHENEFAAEGLLTFYGGPNGVAPGASVSTEVNLAPGTYVAFCLIHAADGASHAAHGMMAPVVVTDGGTATDLSALGVEGTVSLTENEFAISPGFDGQGRLLVTNDGAEVHEIVITHLGEGATFEELRASLAGGGSPEGTGLSGEYAVTQGVTAISPGVSIVVELDLAQGDYVLSCLSPDFGDFLPHTMHGEITLVHYPA